MTYENNSNEKSNGRVYVPKKWMKYKYDIQQQTTTTELQVPDLGYALHLFLTLLPIQFFFSFFSFYFQTFCGGGINIPLFKHLIQTVLVTETLDTPKPGTSYLRHRHNMHLI